MCVHVCFSKKCVYDVSCTYVFRVDLLELGSQLLCFLHEKSAFPTLSIPKVGSVSLLRPLRLCPIHCSMPIGVGFIEVNFDNHGRTVPLI